MYVFILFEKCLDAWDQFQEDGNANFFNLFPSMGTKNTHHKISAMSLIFQAKIPEQFSFWCDKQQLQTKISNFYYNVTAEDPFFRNMTS